jgi:hypothetical protein
MRIGRRGEFADLGGLYYAHCGRGFMADFFPRLIGFWSTPGTKQTPVWRRVLTRCGRILGRDRRSRGSGLARSRARLQHTTMARLLPGQHDTFWASCEPRPWLVSLSLTKDTSMTVRIVCVGRRVPGTTVYHRALWNTTGACLLVMPAAVFMHGDRVHWRHRVSLNGQSVMKHMESDIVQLAIQLAGNV